MKKYSYWLDTVDQDFLKDANLPEKSDALVVGFGYTGLHAAFEMAKNGMKVCVIDKCNLVMVVRQKMGVKLVIY